MSEIPTREILWNVPANPNIAIMYVVFVLSLIIAAVGLYRHIELWVSGKQEQYRNLPWHQRFFNLISWAFLQKRVKRTRPAGTAHTLVYIGFVVLLIATTMVALQYDFGLPVFVGTPYLAITLLSDIFGFGLIIGCLIFAHRRYITSSTVTHNRLADSSVLIVLILLCVQGFILEGLRIHATNDPWALYSPVGYVFAKAFWPLSIEATKTLHFFTWWFHAITVFLVIALTPYTKFFHIFASSINIFFRDSARPKGRLPFPGDIEKRMESEQDFSIGLGTIKDYTWKQLLDLDACTSCGRCQEVCPAYRSNKPLSPKWMILDTRNHALLLHNQGALAESKLPKPFQLLDTELNETMLFQAQGIDSAHNTYVDNGSFRSSNTLVNRSFKSIGADAAARIAESVIDPSVFWSCTTCYACVEACPVGINHVDLIVENRRNMALMQGEIPSEAQATLRALENRKNPYGDPADRIKWLDGLDVKILKPGDSVQVLYWVGCVSAFDPRKQKIARSLVKIMKHAGLSFGILGTSEGCTGDPARRLGEENIFQSLAKNNLEVLSKVRFETLVANCPHCFNTIKNEYPQLGNLGNGESPEIIHHSQMIKKLIKNGKIELKDDGSGDSSVVFHDPCYLGRYNNEYEAPRQTIKAVKGLKVLEMEDNKEKGLCCGAGGGHFWMDLKIGDRVNVIRAEQAVKTNAQEIATACPFCMQMMEDGLKLINKESSTSVRDIAEIIAGRLR